MKKIIFFLACLPTLAFADIKVSNMTEDLQPASTDYMYIVANSTSMKVGIGNLLNVGSTNYLAATTSATFNQTLLQASSFTTFGSSMPFSYLGKSSTPWTTNGYLIFSDSVNFNTSLTQLSSFTAFTSSMPLSYLGISSGPNAGSGNYWQIPSSGTFFNPSIQGSTVNAVTVLNIPTGANPQIGASGRLGLDTTANQILSNDGTNDFVLTQATHSWTLSISSGIGFYGSTMAFACAPPNSGITLTSLRASSLPTGTTVQYSLDYRSFGSEGNTGSSIVSLTTANVTGLETLNFTNSTPGSGACVYLILPSTDTSQGNPINLKLNLNWKYTRQ